MELHVPLSSKGQVTVPKEVRETLRMSPGDRLTFKEQKGRVYIEKYIEVVVCPVCEGNGRLSSKTEPCFICKESGKLDANFSVLQSLPIWQKLYQVKTICKIDTDINDQVKLPELTFRTNSYTQKTVSRSRDFAILHLVKELQIENQGFLSISEYQELLEQLELPESHIFMRLFEISGVN